VAEPQPFATFFANLGATTGNLLVRGGAGTSADVITLRRAGSFGETFQVSVDVGDDVPGTGTTGPWVTNFNLLAGAVKSVTVNPGDGGDVVYVEDTFPDMPVSVNTGAGDDVILLSPTAYDLDHLASGL